MFKKINDLTTISQDLLTINANMDNSMNTDTLNHLLDLENTNHEQKMCVKIFNTLLVLRSAKKV